MRDLDKQNTAHNYVLANYLIQQQMNANISAVEKQTEWLQAGISQPECPPAGVQQLYIGAVHMAEAMHVTVGTQPFDWGQTRVCLVSGYQTTTFGMPPSIEARIQNTVNKVRVLVSEFENRYQFTDTQIWAVAGDIFEYLRYVQRVEEVIGLARYAGLEAIADRLVELRSDEDELEPGEQPMNLLSLKQCLRFLLRHSELKKPGITVTFEGNVKATWQQSVNQIFWVEFYPSNDVRYLSFVPDEERSDHVERTASWSTISHIYDRAIELRAIDWMIG